MVACIPIFGSFFNAHVAFLMLTHNCLVTENHVVEATGIDAWHCDTQEFANTTDVPARQYCSELVQGASAHAQQGEAPAIQSLQQALHLIEHRKRWRCG